MEKLNRSKGEKKGASFLMHLFKFILGFRSNVAL